MNNKLGINEERMNKIEKELVKMKLNFLDEYFTFNNQELNFNFLKCLHDFLFCDFYYKKDLNVRKMSFQEEKLINIYLRKIINICITKPQDIDNILQIVCSIWEMQPFIIGNTRTLIAYLKIINSGYLLGLDIDINKNIESNPSMFKKENFVNQKQLTKVK